MKLAMMGNNNNAVAKNQVTEPNISGVFGSYFKGSCELSLFCSPFLSPGLSYI